MHPDTDVMKAIAKDHARRLQAEAKAARRARKARAR
jgi:hypothetical protein